MVSELLPEASDQAHHLEVLQVLTVADGGPVVDLLQLQEGHAGGLHQSCLRRLQGLHLQSATLCLVLVGRDLLLAVSHEVAQGLLILGERSLGLLQILVRLGLASGLLGLDLLSFLQGLLGKAHLVLQRLLDHLEAVLCLGLLAAQLTDLVLRLVQHVFQHLDHATTLALVDRRSRSLQLGVLVLQKVGQRCSILVADHRSVHHGLDRLEETRGALHLHQGTSFFLLLLQS
mmetsp:Transcript_68954/g.164279  ORF Transcript_68954/g.164279 Transcript_68954/m.164279 type:complete len:231 (-) Transcript_68954:511-1203(-)